MLQVDGGGRRGVGHPTRGMRGRGFPGCQPLWDGRCCLPPSCSVRLSCAMVPPVVDCLLSFCCPVFLVKNSRDAQVPRRAVARMAAAGQPVGLAFGKRTRYSCGTARVCVWPPTALVAQSEGALPWPGSGLCPSSAQGQRSVRRRQQGAIAQLASVGGWWPTPTCRGDAGPAASRAAPAPAACEARVGRPADQQRAMALGGRAPATARRGVALPRWCNHVASIASWCVCAMRAIPALASRALSPRGAS